MNGPNFRWPQREEPSTHAELARQEERTLPAARTPHDFAAFKRRLGVTEDDAGAETMGVVKPRRTRTPKAPKPETSAKPAQPQAAPPPAYSAGLYDTLAFCRQIHSIAEIQRAFEALKDAEA